MPSLPKEVAEFMKNYGVTADEVWPVPGGKAYAVKHKALERIAIEKGIVFERPSVVACDLEQKSMVICTFGKMGERTEWSFGEASPANNKNQYMAAMAEKRSRDRVILKLLAAHGDLYSEEEADDFKRSTQEEDHIPEEHIIKRDDGIQVLTMDAQRPIFMELERELLNCSSVEELKRWKVSARTRASRLSDHWKTDLNKRYLQYLRTLEKRDADEYQERMAG
jgi:hypothetical protein